MNSKNKPVTIDSKMDIVAKLIEQSRTSAKMSNGKVLHIFVDTNLYHNLIPQFPDLIDCENNDVIHHHNMFEAGLVPKDLSEKEVERYLDKASYEDTYNDDRHFFDILSRHKENCYEEVILWYEESTNALMLASVIATLYLDCNLSIITLVGTCDGGYLDVVKQFENRMRLNNVEKRRIASLWDKDEWNQDKLFFIEELSGLKISEYPKDLMKSYILKNLRKDEEYTNCNRLIYTCIGYSERNVSFPSEVYYDLIVEMVKDGTLTARQTDNEKVLYVMAKNGGDLFSPNGVNISGYLYFDVAKTEKR